MDPFMKFASVTSDWNKMVSVERGTAAARLSFPTELLNSVTFKQSVETLHASVSMLTLAAGKAVETLNENGWNERAPGDVKAILRPAYRAVVQAGMNRARELENQRVSLIAMRKVDPAVAAEIRQMLRSLKVGEAMGAALNRPDVAAAAVQAWHLTGLPDNLRPQVEDALIRANLADQFAAQGANFQVRPTVSDPLAHGPDRAAVERQADLAMSGQKASQNEIKMVGELLSNAANFVAVAAGISAEASYELLVAA